MGGQTKGVQKGMPRARAQEEGVLMTGFICHDDYLNKTAKLTDEEVGRLFRACMVYHATGKAKELDGRESIAFDFIREDIDRAEKAYQEKCETNRKNRLAKITVDINRQPPTTNDDHRQPPSTVVKEQKQKFVKPSVEEVAAYCKERGNNVDPEAFVAFYESKGWRVGAQPMKSWKACIVTWEKRERAVPTKTVIAQQYEQRDYSGVQEVVSNDYAGEIERRLKAKGQKKVIAQMYDQRDYSGVQDELMEQQDRDMEEFMKNEKGAS